MHILTVEDDPLISKLIETILLRSNINVSVTNTGEEAIDLASVYDYDLILLDLRLPDMSGYDVLRKLRHVQIDTPVLILTGATDTDSKLRGFGLGADDYVIKPFKKDELIARIHAIVRRSNGHSNSVIRAGRVAVDLDAKTAEVDGSPINLTKKEFQILEVLSLRPGITLTKEQLLNHLYGGIDEPGSKIIDVFVCKLRKKLVDATGEECCIQTVWGRGYRMSCPKHVEAA